VHRIGRTARAGRNGESILFLTEPEVPYISFLQGKKVDIKEMNSEVTPSWQTYCDLIQEKMLSDKDLVDKSQDAFVSFIRYYKEHQLTFIFNF
jgi:ATP-dependent RNA helicase DDX55/SPB4